MAPGFRKSIRGLLASVRGSIMDSPGEGLDDPMEKILDHQHATTWADVAFSNIIKCGDGHTLLTALQTDYRICRVGHFKKRPRKVFQDVVEHEYIIVHLRYQGKTTFFRIDRSIGPRSDKDNDKKKTSDSTNSLESSSEVSTPSHPPSSGSSSSMESILMYPSRLVNYCVCRMSTITSSRHWAKDTIVQVPEIPSKSDSYELTTIEFTGLSHSWPSLWDLLHTVQFLNQQCEEHNVIDAQCYWYADMISGMLEDWCQGAAVTRHHGWQGTKSRLSVPAPGTFKGVPIYKRDLEVIRTKKTAVIDVIKTTTKSTLEFLDLKKGADQKIQQISADAEEQIQSLSRQLRDAELRVGEAEARARQAGDFVQDMTKHVEPGEDRVETRVRAVEERADARVSQMAQQMKDAEDRAEARVSEMAKQMRDAEERAEGRVSEMAARLRRVEERAETKIQELSVQLQRSQELVVGFETRASARDELMERIMARLEEGLPKSGNSQLVVA